MRDQLAGQEGLRDSIWARHDRARAATAGCRSRGSGATAGSARSAGAASGGGTRRNRRRAGVLPRTPAGGLLWRSVLSPLLGRAPALVVSFGYAAIRAASA